jgi:hypothetical protein
MYTYMPTPTINEDKQLAKSPESSPVARYQASSYTSWPIPMRVSNRLVFPPKNQVYLCNSTLCGVVMTCINLSKLYIKVTSSDGNSLPCMSICSNMLLNLELPAGSTQGYGLQGH